MDFESEKWEDLNASEQKLAIEWYPPPIHPQLREAFRECVEDEVKHFDLGEKSFCDSNFLINFIDQRCYEMIRLLLYFLI